MNEILNQTYGVEVEMFNITRAKAAQVVAAVLTRETGKEWSVSSPGCHLDERKIYCLDGSDPKVWKIESDSSIQARTPAEKAELVSPILTWEDMDVLQAVVRGLRHAGARSAPSHQCGIHVHVNGEGHTAVSLRNLSNIMASHQQLLKVALNLDARRMHWCAPVDPRFLQELNRQKPSTLGALKAVWYRSQGCRGYTHYDSSRYHMLNLHSFFEGKGVEFRLFQFDEWDGSKPVGQRGGIHAGQLKAYVQLCLAMNYRALHTRSANPTPLQSENPRYTMRCWLLRLGFIGDEFTTAREIFTRRLPGDCSFRNGRPSRAAC